MLRFALAFALAFLSSLNLYAQGAQTAQPAPPSDPQAVAIVQAAITAFGGATAISASQSWTFQANLQGPTPATAVSYTVTTQVEGPVQVATPAGIKSKLMQTRSYFVPALVGYVLLTESKDPSLSFSYRGTATFGTKTVKVVTASIALGTKSVLPVQVWWFDSESVLPVRVSFTAPAVVGSQTSYYCAVDLSNYQNISGVQYPFFIGTMLSGGLPEIVTIQSVTPSTTASEFQLNDLAGDLSQ